VPGGVIGNTIEVRAKVTAIDQTTRKATLLGPDGKKFTVKAPPEAINLVKASKSPARSWPLISRSGRAL
jgi:hypothetical protein